jgi:hypothetical protein
VRRRRLAAGLALGLAAALAAASWPWLRAEVVPPVALLAWLLLRVFVLSIHQAVFWLAAVAGVAAAAIHGLRAALAEPPVAAPPEASGRRAPGARRAWSPAVERWRARLAARVAGTAVVTWGWDDLVGLCLRACALARRVPADHRLHDAVRAGEVPLPAAVRAHLFPTAPGLPAGRLRRLLVRAGRAARAALHRETGRARAERLRAAGEVLSFLEEASGGGERWPR